MSAGVLLLQRVEVDLLVGAGLGQVVDGGLVQADAGPLVEDVAYRGEVVGAQVAVEDRGEGT